MSAGKVLAYKGPTSNKRLILAVPTYGHVDPYLQKTVRAAIMFAANTGITWVGDVSPDRMGYSAARNAVAKICMESPEADGVMWIDSDIAVPTNAIASLIHAADLQDAEFVTGVYHQRGGNKFPLVAMYAPEKNLFNWVVEWPENIMAKIDGCGFGFVYTARSVFEKIANLDDFTKEIGWFRDQRDWQGLGEDFYFCRQAMKAGVQLWVHTGVQVGHSGESVIITRADFLHELERLKKENRPIDGTTEISKNVQTNEVA